MHKKAYSVLATCRHVHAASQTFSGLEVTAAGTAASFHLIRLCSDCAPSICRRLLSAKERRTAQETTRPSFSKIYVQPSPQSHARKSLELHWLYRPTARDFFLCVFQAELIRVADLSNLLSITAAMLSHFLLTDITLHCSSLNCSHDAGLGLCLYYFIRMYIPSSYYLVNIALIITTMHL